MLKYLVYYTQLALEPVYCILFSKLPVLGLNVVFYGVRTCC